MHSEVGRHSAARLALPVQSPEMAWTDLLRDQEPSNGVVFARQSSPPQTSPWCARLPSRLRPAQMDQMKKRRQNAAGTRQGAGATARSRRRSVLSSAACEVGGGLGASTIMSTSCQGTSGAHLESPCPCGENTQQKRRAQRKELDHLQWFAATTAEHGAGFARTGKIVMSTTCMSMPVPEVWYICEPKNFASSQSAGTPVATPCSICSRRPTTLFKARRGVPRGSTQQPRRLAVWASTQQRQRIRGSWVQVWRRRRCVGRLHLHSSLRHGSRHCLLGLSLEPRECTRAVGSTLITAAAASGAPAVHGAQRSGRAQAALTSRGPVSADAA